MHCWDLPTYIEEPNLGAFTSLDVYYDFLGIHGMALRIMGAQAT